MILKFQLSNPFRLLLQYSFLISNSNFFKSIFELKPFKLAYLNYLKKFLFLSIGDIQHSTQNVFVNISCLFYILFYGLFSNKRSSRNYQLKDIFSMHYRYVHDFFVLLYSIPNVRQLQVCCIYNQCFLVLKNLHLLKKSIKFQQNNITLVYNKDSDFFLLIDSLYVAL